ncbi:MAG: putative S-layer protein [Nanoarchaeota archaeon]|nr:putative S-layer protein [Nanoarchaeota archaeon]
MKIKLALTMVLALLLLSVCAAAADIGITGISTASGNPGDTVSLNITVSNGGNTNISSVTLTSTALTYNGNSITAPSLEPIVNLNAGSTAIKTFSVTLPSLAAGTYTGTITAGNGNQTDTESYSVTINAKTDFSITQSKVSIKAQADDLESAVFTIRNTGSTTLTSFALSYTGTFTDDDLDGIIFDFSSLASLAPGQSADITVTADIERHVDLDTYEGTIHVLANGIERTVPLEVEVQPEICSDGRAGYLRISIEKPDNGDSFTPGEDMEIKVNVDNDYNRKLNVAVEAILYNLDENKDIASAVSDSEYIDDGDSETLELTLRVPSKDIDEDDEFYLFVKAYKVGDEDEHCDYERIEVELERDDESVVISELKVSNANPTCTDTVTATVEVENTGLEDQENVYIRLQAKAFGLDIESDDFDINAYDENGNKHTKTFVFSIGNVEEISEKLTATVYYGNSDSDSKEILLTAGKCDAEAKKLMSEAKLMLSIEEENMVLPPGKKKFVLALIIENKGGKPAAFTVDVTEATGWSTVTATEAPSSLGAGEQYHAYIYMQLKDNVAEGVHNFRVNLRDEKGLIFSQMASVDVQLPEEGAPASEDTVVDTGSLTKWLFADKQRMFWIAGDLVLVILAMFFLKLLLRR